MVVDDHRVLLLGIEELILNNLRDVEIIKASDEKSAISLLNGLDVIDLVICDLNLFPLGKTFNVLKKAGLRKVNTIVFSVFENKILIEESKRNGALSYICKRSGELELLRAINEGLKGESCDCSITQTILGSQFIHFTPIRLKLTNTEKTLVKCWASGMSNSDIIERFQLNENTLRTHRRHILFNNKCNYEQLLFCFNSFHEAEEIDISKLYKRR